MGTFISTASGCVWGEGIQAAVHIKNKTNPPRKTELDDGGYEPATGTKGAVRLTVTGAEEGDRNGDHVQRSIEGQQAWYKMPFKQRGWLHSGRGYLPRYMGSDYTVG